MKVVWVPMAAEPPGFPDETLKPEEYKRITRLASLEDFDPTKFGLPPRNGTKH